jgi:Cu/Ag efflux protein CusF
MIRSISAALLSLGLAATALAQSALADAEVRKVDKSRGKITLKHGEIANIDMPPMTMVFPVRDKALLDKVKAGDKVKFAAEKDGAGEIVVTAIEVQR